MTMDLTGQTIRCQNQIPAITAKGRNDHITSDPLKHRQWLPNLECSYKLTNNEQHQH